MLGTSPIVRRSVRALLAIALAPVGASAQIGTWTQLGPATSPPARNLHGVAEAKAGAGQPNQSSLLMFGGETKNPGGAQLNDTWRWNGTDWALLQPATKPSTRSGFTFTRDPLRDRVVMFSGWNGSQYLNDTWEWGSNDWHLISTPIAPPHRDFAASAFDPNTNTTLLFGGHDWVQDVTGFGPYGDTWTWDGVTWVNRNPATSPPPRHGHNMIYDPNRGTVLLLGGQDFNNTNLNDMWEWNGTTWAQINTPQLPSPRNWFGLAWDADRKVVVLHGGVGGIVAGSVGQNLNDTWEWDGAFWTQTGTSGPARSYSPLVYDTKKKHMLQFGGATQPDRSATDNLTWTYDGPSLLWQNLQNGLAGQLGAPLLLGTGVPAGGSPISLSLTNALPATTAYLIIGLSNLSMPFHGGTFVPNPNFVLILPTGSGSISAGAPLPLNVPPGVALFFQYWILDGSGPVGLTASNALSTVTQ